MPIYEENIIKQPKVNSFACSLAFIGAASSAFACFLRVAIPCPKINSRPLLDRAQLLSNTTCTCLALVCGANLERVPNQGNTSSLIHSLTHARTHARTCTDSLYAPPTQFPSHYSVRPTYQYRNINVIHTHTGCWNTSAPPIFRF